MGLPRYGLLRLWFTGGMHTRGFIIGLLFAISCFAQNWELGGAIGYGVYKDGSIDAGPLTAKAGIHNRFAAGAVLGYDAYDHLSGEVRYTYQDGDPYLSSGGTKTNLQGNSFAVTYDLLFQLRPREAKLRPYVTAGLGVKDYVVSGPFNPNQPLTAIATITTNDQVKTAFVLGAGVKYALGQHWMVRGDVLDYITTFPRTLILPVQYASARGVFHMFTPMFGLSYRF